MQIASDVIRHRRIGPDNGVIGIWVSTIMKTDEALSWSVTEQALATLSQKTTDDGDVVIALLEN